MISDDLHSPLAVLAASDHRREILTLLRESNAQVTNTTLTERSSAERSTVHRAIQHLADNGWVQKTAESHIKLTVAGQLVLRAYERFCEQESETTFLFLTHSPTRVEILRYLFQQAKDQDQQIQYCQSAAIARHVTGSRSTISRGLSDCTDRGWLSKGTGAQYALTDTGERVRQAYDTLNDIMSWITTNAACLNRFNTDSTHTEIGTDIPLEPLTDEITAVEAKDANPDAPFLHYREQLTATQPATLHGMLPVASLQADITRTVLADTNTTIELIIDEPAIAAARKSYPTQFAAVCADERITILEHPSPLEIGIALFDETAVLGAYDDENSHLHAILTSSAEPFIKYITSVYNDYYCRSIPLE